MTTISELIRANPVFASFVAMGVGGSLFGILKTAPQRLFGWLKSRIFFTLEVSNSDQSAPVHRWLSQWVAANAKSRYVTACAFYERDDEGGPHRARKPRIAFVPRLAYFFKFEGRRFLAWQSDEPVEGTITRRSTITLYLPGRGEALMKALILAAYEFAVGIDGSTIEIFVWDGYGNWHSAERKICRPMSSLILPDGIGERIFADAKNFLAARQWYAEMGIPWRRGYLFKGNHGNGKSSLAHALASELGMGINILNLAAFKNDAELMQAAGAVPAGNIMLIEDIDAAWSGREKKSDGGITFSGLLNCIDGIAAKDGRILVMTTNHPEKLDAALIRPGRADIHFEISDATDAQAGKMLLRFFPDSSPSDLREFSQRFAGKNMASIQEELLHRVSESAGTMRMAS